MLIRLHDPSKTTLHIEEGFDRTPRVILEHVLPLSSIEKNVGRIESLTYKHSPDQIPQNGRSSALPPAGSSKEVDVSDSGAEAPPPLLSSITS